MIPALSRAEGLAMQAWSSTRRPRAPIKKNLMVGLRDNGLGELCDYPVNVALRTLRAVGSPKYRVAAAQTLSRWVQLTGGYENSTTAREWEETKRIPLRVQFSMERGENPLELELVDEYDCSDEAFTEETHRMRRPFAEWCDVLEFTYKDFVGSRVADPTISLVEFLALALAYIDQDVIDPANERTMKDWADSLTGVGIKVYDLIERADERKDEFMTLGQFLGEINSAFVQRITQVVLDANAPTSLADLRAPFAAVLVQRFDGLGTDIATTLKPRAYVDQLNSRVQQLIYEGDIPGMVGKYVARVDELRSHGKELNDKLKSSYDAVAQYLEELKDPDEEEIPVTLWTSQGYWFSITNALEEAERFKTRASEVYLAIHEASKKLEAAPAGDERNRLRGVFAETVIQFLRLSIHAFAPLLSDTRALDQISHIGGWAQKMIKSAIGILKDRLGPIPNPNFLTHVTELGGEITLLMRAIDDDVEGYDGNHASSLVQAYIDQALEPTSAPLDGTQLMARLAVADFDVDDPTTSVIKSAFLAAGASTSDAVVTAFTEADPARRRHDFLATLLDPSLRSIRKTRTLLPDLADADIKRRLAAEFGKDITTQVDTISAIKNTAFEDAATLKIHKNGNVIHQDFKRYRDALRQFAKEVFNHAHAAKIVSIESFWFRHRHGRNLPALDVNHDFNRAPNERWPIGFLKDTVRRPDDAAHDLTEPGGSDDMHNRLYNTPPTIRPVLFVEAERRLLTQLENLKERDRSVLMRSMGGVAFRKAEAELRVLRADLEEQTDAMEKKNDFDVRTRETASKEATRFSQTFMEMVHVLQLHTDSIAMLTKANKADERAERRRAVAAITNASRAKRLRSHLLAMVSRYYGDAMRCTTLYKYVYAVVMCDDGTFTWQSGDRRRESQRRFVARLENPEEDYATLLQTIEQRCEMLQRPTPQSRVRHEGGLDDFCRQLRGNLADQWRVNMEHAYRHDGHPNVLKEKDMDSQRLPVYPAGLNDPEQKNRALSHFTAQLRVVPLRVNVVYEDGRGVGEFFIKLLEDGVNPTREVLVAESVPWFSRGETLRTLRDAKIDVERTMGEKTFSRLSPEAKMARVLAWTNKEFEQFEHYRNKRASVVDPPTTERRQRRRRMDE